MRTFPTQSQLTSKKSSDNKFDGEDLAFFHQDCIGVGHREQGIGRDVLCLLHPPAAGLIQHLPLHSIAHFPIITAYPFLICLLEDLAAISSTVMRHAGQESVCLVAMNLVASS